MKEGGVSIHFEIRDTYLYVKLTGEDSFDASMKYWTTISEKAKQLQMLRVLVHENLTGAVSEGEMFEIMQQVAPSGAGIKVALFDENLADQDLNELGQLIALNRGADVRIFHTLEAAEEWIKGESDQRAVM